MSGQTTATISKPRRPGERASFWFSLFNNWETFGAQFLALVIVIGSYVGAQYLRVWRPRWDGPQPARFAERIPDRPADVEGYSIEPAISGRTRAGTFAT